MASMAFSTVAWAVIMMICGRSPSGTVATSSRISSRPVRSGMRWSTTRTSKERSASSRCASRALGGRHHLVALLAEGAAERLQDPLLVVDEQDGAARAPALSLAPPEAPAVGSSIRISVPSPEPAPRGNDATEGLHDVLGDGETRGRCPCAWS